MSCKLKKAFVLFCVLSLFSIASSAGAYTLMESYNASDVNPSNSYWYATQVALEYIPTGSYNLERVEIFTGYQDKAGVIIALRPDNNGVSSTILASGSYNNVAQWGWQGATFSSPYAVNAGTHYWITWYDTNNLGAPITNTSGERHNYFWGDGADINSYPNGPYNDGFQAKFYGESTVPEPATMLLLGFGLAGLAGVRRFR